MKLKNSQVVSFINGAVELKGKSLPIKVGYAIARNLKTMEGVAAAYEEERMKVLDKYAEKDSEGKYIVKCNAYVISDLENYNHEMEELLEIENEISLHTVPFLELEKCDSDKFDALSVQDIQVMEIMTD